MRDLTIVAVMYPSPDPLSPPITAKLKVRKKMNFIYSFLSK